MNKPKKVGEEGVRKAENARFLRKLCVVGLLI
jgi:hypothetical protein